MAPTENTTEEQHPGRLPEPGEWVTQVDTLNLLRIRYMQRGKRGQSTEVPPPLDELARWIFEEAIRQGAIWEYVRSKNNASEEYLLLRGDPAKQVWTQTMHIAIKLRRDGGIEIWYRKNPGKAGRGTKLVSESNGTITNQAGTGGQKFTVELSTAQIALSEVLTSIVAMLEYKTQSG